MAWWKGVLARDLKDLGSILAPSLAGCVGSVGVFPHL